VLVGSTKSWTIATPPAFWGALEVTGVDAAIDFFLDTARAPSAHAAPTAQGVAQKWAQAGAPAEWRPRACRPQQQDRRASKRKLDRI